jgi:peptidoglycan/xylan/chitin deacetylase (PgdA/CDA1 family)
MYHTGGAAMRSEGIKWPGGARCAVFFTIHVDGESLYNRRSTPSPRSESYGAYGPLKAVDRLLEITDRREIPCTYFVPGQIAKRYPDMMKKIDAMGHEIGFHGYDHESAMYTDRSEDEWIGVIERSQEVFEGVIGKRAVGYCATSSDFGDGAPKIWRSLGFEYSSSMRGDDRPYRTVFDGEPSDFIEIPARWELDDYPSFVYNFSPPQPKGLDRISSYRGVFDNWRHEFDGYYTYGLCMVFMLHPQIIGIPGRARLLGELMDYMRGHRDVWFASGGDIARWWLENY